MILEGKRPSRVRIKLLTGDDITIAIHMCSLKKNGEAICSVIKDAGDDPDVTHLATIRARVATAPAGQGVSFHAGPGVGTVTKPGLPIPPGDPAINPVPREMLKGVLKEAAESAGIQADFDVTISVDNGAELAKKTWNPRLGIEGGLSILGTTGIVRPFSCSAWIASIHRGIDVARASGLSHVVGATGSTSEATVRNLYDLPEIAFLDMGDFAGGMLKYLRRHPVERLTIAGGIGKLTKMAQGAMDLHSGRSQVDFAKLAEMAERVGADPAPVAAANTALEALEAAGPALAQAVADGAASAAEEALRETPIAIEVIVTDRSGTIHGRREFPA